jgi:hypothetical protein
MTEHLETVEQPPAAAPSTRTGSPGIAGAAVVLLIALATVCAWHAFRDVLGLRRSVDGFFRDVHARMSASGGARRAPSHRVRVLPSVRPRRVVVGGATPAGRVCRFCGLGIDEADHDLCEEGDIDD